MTAIEAAVTVAEAARLIDRTPRRVRQMMAAGVIPAQPDGLVRILDVVAGHGRVLADEKTKRAAGATDQRLRDVRVEEVALRNEERTRKLIADARAEAVEVVDELAGALRTDLASVAARVTPDPVMRRKIRDEIDGCFREAAARAEREGRGAVAARRPVAAPGKGRAGRVGPSQPAVSAHKRPSGAA